MYSTLNLLKKCRACKPGYSRMLSFFGTSQKLKEQKIPLHVIALVGGAQDTRWAAKNSLVIDKEEFQVFYKKHFLAVFRHLLYVEVLKYRSGSSVRETEKAYPELLAFIEQASELQTSEQAMSFYTEHLHRYAQHRFYEDFIHSSVLSDPCRFIWKCIEIVESTYDADRHFLSKVPLAAVRNTVSPFGYTANDSDEDEDEDDSPSSLKGQWYYISTTVKGRSTGQNVAYMFSDDPYSFMKSMEYKVPRGVKMSKAGKAVSLEVVLSDEQDMFDVLRSLNRRVTVDTDVEADEDEAA